MLLSDSHRETGQSASQHSLNLRAGLKRVMPQLEPARRLKRMTPQLEPACRLKRFKGHCAVGHSTVVTDKTSFYCAKSEASDISIISRPKFANYTWSLSREGYSPKPHSLSTRMRGHLIIQG